MTAAVSRREVEGSMAGAVGQTAEYPVIPLATAGTCPANLTVALAQGAGPVVGAVPVEAVLVLAVSASPALVTQTFSSYTVSLPTAVRHLALIQPHAALLPLPVLVTVAPTSAILPVTTAQHRTDAGGAVGAGELPLTLTLATRQAPTPTTAVVLAASPSGPRADHQAELQAGRTVVVYAEVPDTLAEKGQHDF